MSEITCVAGRISEKERSLQSIYGDRIPLEEVEDVGLQVKSNFQIKENNKVLLFVEEKNGKMFLIVPPERKDRMTTEMIKKANELLSQYGVQIPEEYIKGTVERI